MLADFAVRSDLVRASSPDVRVTVNVGVADAQGVDDTSVCGDVAHISGVFAGVELAVGAFAGVAGIVAVGGDAVAVQVNVVFSDEGVEEEAAPRSLDPDGAGEGFG